MKIKFKPVVLTVALVAGGLFAQGVMACHIPDSNNEIKDIINTYINNGHSITVTEVHEGGLAMTLRCNLTGATEDSFTVAADPCFERCITILKKTEGTSSKKCGPTPSPQVVLSQGVLDWCKIK